MQTRRWKYVFLFLCSSAITQCSQCNNQQATPVAPVAQTPNNNTTNIAPSPAAVNNAPPAAQLQFADVAPARNSSIESVFAVLSDGSVWEYSAATNGTRTRTRVPGITTATKVAVFSNMACVLLRDGSVQCWRPGTPAPQTRAVAGLTNARAIAGYEFDLCALLADQTVRCWSNAGTAGELRPETRGAGVSGVQQIALGAAPSVLLADGTVRSWRVNGAGHETQQATPVAGVSGATQITACGGYVCARRNDGSVWCWGWDSNAQAVPGVTNAVQVECSEAFGDNENSAGTITYRGSGEACAVTATGALRCWTHSGNLDGLTSEAPTDAPAVPAGSRLAFGSAPESDGTMRRCIWTPAAAKCDDVDLVLPTPADYAATPAAAPAPTPVPTPTPTPTPTPASASGETSECDAFARASFHLRPREVLESVGPELPAGSAVRVLSRATLRRGATQMFRVRTTDGREGFMFLEEEEVPSGCPAATTN